MKVQLINFDTAKLAKEKGFDFYVPFCYDMNGRINDYSIGLTYSLWLAPTQSFLQKWLRDKHETDIQILGVHNQYYIGIHKKNLHTCSEYLYPNLSSYEETLEFGLISALEYVK